MFCVRCCSFLNGTIHEVETRYRRKDERKRSCKYFNAFIVYVMLVGFSTFEIHAAGNYQKVKKYTGHATKWVLSLSKHSNRSRIIQYETIWSFIIL